MKRTCNWIIRIKIIQNQNHSIANPSLVTAQKWIQITAKLLEEHIIVSTLHLMVFPYLQSHDLKNTQHKTHRQQRKCVTWSYGSKSRYVNSHTLTRNQCVRKCVLVNRCWTHLCSRRGTCQTERTISSSTSSSRYCPAKVQQHSSRQSNQPTNHSAARKAPPLSMHAYFPQTPPAVTALLRYCYPCCCWSLERKLISFLRRVI